MTATSPKRKRGDILPLDTKGQIPRLLDESDSGDHVESPRTKVARRFDDLDIHGSLEELDNDCMNTPTPPTGNTGKGKIDADAHSRILLSPKNKGKQQSPPVMATEPGTVTTPENAPRSKSPSLEGEPNEEFWHDSEITGHNPDDPDDDGYGINGIGFRPTAAIAWSRSQQRKQQLSEYKNRESREARQRRSERRKRVFDDGDEAPPMESSPRKAARVHFEDG